MLSSLSSRLPRVVSLLLACVFTTAAIAETPDRAHGAPNAAAVVSAMGLGFNLGNTFDLNLRTTDPAEIRPVIDLYVAAGMKHIRIPVSWTEEFEHDNLADHLGNIDAAHPRLRRLHEVVDYALSKGVTIRDDSILTNPRKDAKPWHHADMAQAFWPTLPVMP